MTQDSDRYMVFLTQVGDDGPIGYDLADLNDNAYVHCESPRFATVGEAVTDAQRWMLEHMQQGAVRG